MPETFQFDRVDRIADILYGVATAKGLIRYAPLAKRVGLRPDFLGVFLDKVSTRAAGQDEPLWSALVVAKDSGKPSVGFYGLARKMRPEYSELTDDEVWASERDRCYAAAA
ncbi:MULTISPECIES: hypothetical protein [Micromonospora]|uniref:Uncharacterized protein n=1 Tax=Micromonospora yangpuensis TaxID=683228 RepID=A0A1C6V2M1_9ACTN|nr:hypothetical protein [Micromonospora yangpuensis]GGM32462.1 hypothetical protein GCM10012279_59260 [Micromonospora yangpuensis]SCL60582.1 hypothetical protein GA0070617_4420 [Micromonospora yangpuensis]